MPSISARVVNVIRVEDGDTLAFYTLEGVMIGRQVGGTMVEVDEEPAQKKVSGGIVKSLSPKEIAVIKRRQNEKDMTLEARLQYAKKYNT